MTSSRREGGLRRWFMGWGAAPRAKRASHTPAGAVGWAASDDLQAAYKAIPFSQYISDFVAEAGGDFAGQRYSDAQREGAYRTSVYLFACLRRGANLISQIRVAAEEKQGDRWTRLPETHDLNRLFAQAGERFWFQCYALYALYGRVLIYKRKTRRAAYALQRGQLLTDYPSGAVAGIHIIPNAHWYPQLDEWGSEVESFHFNVPDHALGGRRSIDRREAVYLQDFDPRLQAYNSTSMVDLAINNAITNAAIARWAAHYFMSGALPLLLLSLDGSDPSSMTEQDALRYKNFIERAWQGVFGRFSMRAVFTERRLHVQQAGIDADKVQAPELDRAALNAIASVFQIAPDLIVPPEGGSDNARHKFLVMQAYNDAVIPLAKQWIAQFNADLGLDGSRYRLVLDESGLRALEADRADIANTELSIFNTGAQTFGELQNRLHTTPIPELERFINVNGRFQSIERVLRDDRLPSADIMQYIHPAWTDGVIRRNEYRSLLGFPPDPDRDGYKYELIPSDGVGFAPAGGAVGFPAAALLPSSASAAVAVPPDPRARAGADLQPMDDRGDPNAPPPPLPAASDTPTSAGAARLADDAGAAKTDDAEPVLGRGAVLLLFADDPALHTARGALMRAVGFSVSARARWAAPEYWHCVLAQADAICESDLSRALQWMPSHCPRIHVRLEGLAAVERDEETWVVARLERTPVLDGLRSAVRSGLLAQGARLQPEDADIPFVVLAHLPKEFRVLLPDVHGLLEATEFTAVHGARVLERRFPIPVLNEVDAWEGAARDEYAARGRGYAEEHLDDIARRRAVLRAMFERWASSGVRPRDFPADVEAALDEALMLTPDVQQVIAAALQALDRGALDEAAVCPSSPIVEHIDQGRAVQEDAYAELRAWERAAQRNRVKAAKRFEVRFLPPEVEALVRTRLQTADETGDEAVYQAQLGSVFEEARERLASLYPPLSVLDLDLLAAWAERMQEIEALRPLVADPDPDSLPLFSTDGKGEDGYGEVD